MSEISINVNIDDDDEIGATMGTAVDWDEIVNKPSTFPPAWPSGGSDGDVLTKSGNAAVWGSGGGGASSWNDLTGKPFETVGENLKVVNGALAVDTATAVQKDNTKPITSAAVHTEIGNIEALMATI